MDFSGEVIDFSRQNAIGQFSVELNTILCEGVSGLVTYYTFLAGNAGFFYIHDLFSGGC